ncbi:MAG: GLPGLI family protein [Bacteroidaceae bacterium]|nr:GLPGLI family protein [Bacteroidaceae bacterium]
MKRKLFIIATLFAMTAGAQNVDMNNQELMRLQQQSETRVKNQQKRLSPYDTNSRGKALNPMLPDCRDVSKFQTKDQGTIRISYAFNAQNIAAPKTYDDLQRLEIGKKFVKYYGYYVYEADSIATAELKEMNRIMHSNMPFPDEGLSMSINGKHQGWSRYLFSEFFKDLSKNELIEYSRMPEALQSYECYYTEPTPKQNWQIMGETKTIVGYQCQKATCSFRGRNYTAWFAVDIPLCYGPWKFCGLPGLILEVYDDKKEYVFECVGIEQPQHGFSIILLDNYKTYRKTTRTELDRTLKRICENYYQITGMTNVVNKQLRPYNPMELK